MRSQIDSYSMLISSKYLRNIKDMINVTFVNSKFKDNFDKFHFNPFQINHKTRHYFINLQTQWLFDEKDEIFSDGDISAYYVYYQIAYLKYLPMKDKYENINFRRIIYTTADLVSYRNEIPNVVNKLDDEIYHYSDIREIVIPDSVVEIGKYCFYNCMTLTSITISSRLTNIGEHVFNYCSLLTTITLPSVLTSLNKHVFYGCNQLKTIEYSPFVVNLNDYLFFGSKGLTTITIPTSITRIGDWCFGFCKLTSLTILCSVKVLGEYAFSSNYELKEVELPNNMVELVDGMFDGCKNLTTINIPSSLTKIGDNCFNGCDSLTIPTKLISQPHHIGNCCFNNKGINEITLNNQITYIGDSAFSKNPFEYIAIPHLINKLPDYCFFECKGLTRIELSSSLTSIGSNCFRECIKLKEINIPMSVIEIGIDAFKGCSQLQLITGNIKICKKFKKSFINTPALKQLQFLNENSGCFVV